jgi:hypothetical protein
MSPIVSPRAHAGSRRPALRALDSGEPREHPEEDLAASARRRPALRIVPDGGRESAPRDLAPVLLAGADASVRAILRAEFRATLPSRTEWVEADDVAGVLELAAHSRMAILAGDLEDADADSLISLLGRRHPELPVICVDAPMPAVAGGRG